MTDISDIEVMAFALFFSALIAIIIAKNVKMVFKITNSLEQ